MSRLLLSLLRILRSLPQGLLGMLRKLETLTMTVKKQARCFRDGLVIKIRSAHGRSEAAKTREVRAARRYNITVDPQKSNEVAEVEKYLAELPSCHPWLDNNPAAKASLERGLQQASQGRGRYLGSFAQFADLEIED